MSIVRDFRQRFAFLLLSLLLALHGPATSAWAASAESAARTCKQVSTCEDAVILWCNGYRRADGDGDGIPCENVCSTREQVNEIRRVIGC
ncbi:MAG: excalibur calcium-binding domain-containing protein [Alphaproteobacteria bacterium]|nr:excalibur calcium-binding domain-containing protein [Alphaproteobacteria bacterium]